MGAEELLFLVFALGACGGAIATVVSQNVVRMAFWLIVSLGSVSGLFFLLHADFVAATQLLIYVGGTVVLLVFGVMLTASGPYVQIRTSPAEAFMAGGVGVLMLSLLVWTVSAADWPVAMKVSGEEMALDDEHIAGNTARQLGLGLLGLRPDRDGLASGNTELSSGYLLPFEIVSIHLLVVLIGAAYLARAKRRVTEEGAE